MPRLAIIDALRGVALLLMFAYHFCFDLNYYGFTHFDFNHDSFWLSARSVIVSLFLLLVGISLQLANAHGIRWHSVWRRLLMLAAAAGGVTIASAMLFPNSYIFFGILHFIAVASLLGLAFLRYRWLALFAGIGLLWLGLGFSDPLFNRPPFQWIGLMTYKPITEDYVPLLPWFGVVLLGIFVGSCLPTVGGKFASWQGTAGAWPLLRLAGRHSLLLYLIHQPILLALLYLITLL
ncbi:heparan-alpha-glucosaminide N-acetyltransferase [Sedimenticola sp.]|uniref:heparan-alpha-glucosaminide N-acetyltransferase n=1 Tax=Sedimenticola sp. TaxID=1940285 RepID=UPI003D0F80C7